MKNVHQIDTTVKRARFLCPVENCTKKYFHATEMNHLTEHKIDLGKGIHCIIQ